MQADMMLHMFIAGDHCADWLDEPIGLARGTVSELYCWLTSRA